MVQKLVFGSLATRGQLVPMTGADELPLAGRCRPLVFAGVGLLLSISVRLIHYNQSLWCDEMGVLLDYAHQSWRSIVAAGPGEYVPSNHFLHTILTKLILQMVDTKGAMSPATARTAMLIRLPALIAGSLSPLVLAWPFRQRAPLMAVLLLLFGAFNPYLVEYSDEARGYTLMTLLGIVSTHLLPDGKRRWPIAYGVVSAAMVYTVPVGAMLVLAQGLTVFVLRKSVRMDWMRGALITGVIAILLYVPMARGILYYGQHPQPTPDSFLDFVNQLPRMIWAGEHIPEISSAPIAELVCWAIPTFVLGIGTFFAWKYQVLRVPLLVMATATGLFVIVAFLLPSAGQVRFVPWAALWMVITIAAIGLEIFHSRGKSGLLILVLIFSGWFIYRDIVLLPAQPIRDAIARADAVAPPGSEILVGFLAAGDYLKIYGSLAEHHQLIATPGPVAFLKVEDRSRQTSASLPWLIISFEPMVRDTVPQFWQYIQANYELNQRLPGRISAVAIYQPRKPQ